MEEHIKTFRIHRFSLAVGLLSGMALGLLIGYVWVFRPPPLVLDIPTPLPLPPTPTPSPVVVYVSGEVRSPGVYTLPASSRVVDAVRAAGGLTDLADVNAVNLALPVEDGAHVHIPRQGQHPEENASIRSRPTPVASEGFPVDVNTASLSELEAIPGIGHVMAQRIVKHRPYGAVDDLLRVPGIGPATLKKIRPYVTVGGTP